MTDTLHQAEAEALRDELDAVRKRRDKLAAERAELDAERAPLRSRAAHGDPDAVAQTRQIRDRMTDLDEHLATLDADGVRLEGELADAERAAGRAEALVRVVELTRAAIGHRADGVAAWETMLQVLDEQADAFAQASRDWRAAQGEAERIAAQYELPDDEIEAAGGSPSELHLRSGGHTYGNGELPNGPFADLLYAATSRARKHADA